MKFITKFYEMRQLVEELSAKRKTIGFVPTMGALHEGHLTLLRKSISDNGISIVSIFVNPTQFNNPQDLEKYPKTLNDDIQLLEKEGCDYLFYPTVEEMYPQEVKSDKWDFGPIGNVMEGKNRPGHFDGVATIVNRLFEAVPANKAYFGKKDYQQLLIIKSLVNQLELKTEIIPVDIVRESDGLAMSSRNARLTETQRKIAPNIYHTLCEAAKIAPSFGIEELKAFVKNKIESSKEMSLEYFEIADANTLEPLNFLDKNKPTMGFIVVNMNTVRLIDNIQLF